MRAKHLRYNAGVDLALELEKEGKALIVAPASIEGMKTLTKDKKAILDLYEQGYQEGAKIREFLAG
jgi:predicted patatin/cPLA2 family phospholipase